MLKFVRALWEKRPSWPLSLGNVLCYVCLPVIGLQGIHCLYLEYKKPPPEERKPYSYLGIKRKPYPWGDGTKTLFQKD